MASGRIKRSIISPKKEFEFFPQKIQPRCVRQDRQTTICQQKPGNQENSAEAGPMGSHPSAALKQPISKTMPCGFANVCMCRPSFVMRAELRAITCLHSRHSNARYSSDDKSVEVFFSFTGPDRAPDLSSGEILNNRDVVKAGIIFKPTIYVVINTWSSIIGFSGKFVNPERCPKRAKMRKCEK